MLDPRFKSLCLISSFIGSEKGVNIVEEYDKWSLNPMLLKCYHYVHPMVESKLGCVNQTTNGWKHSKVLKKSWHKSIKFFKRWFLTKTQKSRFKFY
jgi:hypothetical protein